jgi:hypothetical protein
MLLLSFKDDKLMDIIRQHEHELNVTGIIDWVKVSEYMNGTRSAQQCCWRWKSALNPVILEDKNLSSWQKQEVQNMTKIFHYDYVLLLCPCNRNHLLM